MKKNLGSLLMVSKECQSPKMYKDEIKEILDKLKDTADTSFFAVCGSQEELDKMPKSIAKILSIPSKDAKLLLEYITNLQEEKENQAHTIKSLLEENDLLKRDIEVMKRNYNLLVKGVKK